MSEFERYLGIPWGVGGQGPDAYDCVGFTRMVQHKHFGIEMPLVVIPDYDDVRGLVGLLNSHGERAQWLKVDAPSHGDIVLVRAPMHIGVWIDTDGGGVLHCLRGNGVVFSRDATWDPHVLGRKEFFRHRSKA